MKIEDLNKMLEGAANDMPPPKDVQEENELRPSPEKLQARLLYLEFRLSQFEAWAKRWDMNFPNM